MRTLDAEALDAACDAVVSDPNKHVFVANIGYEDLCLRLVRKCLDIFGLPAAGTPSKEEAPSLGFTLNGGTALSAMMDTPYEDEPMGVATGKDFTLLRTRGGKASRFLRLQWLFPLNRVATANPRFEKVR